MKGLKTMTQLTIDTLDGYQLDLLKYWFDKNIGTEYEQDEVDECAWSITFFELTSAEKAKTKRMSDKFQAMDYQQLIAWGEAN